MVVDMDFIVTYVNDGSIKLFERHADSFRKLWPTFDASQIIGTCIDTFHQAPAHQRALLADPRNLPYTTDITVGDAKIQLHVTPVLSPTGQPEGFALEWSDVTALRESAGQVDAINKSQAVISFNMDGIVLDANDNFLQALGYRLEDIQGLHHRTFVQSDEAKSAEYKQFWDDLNAGQYKAAEFKRIAKDGSVIWIQASYNPIMDLNGRPFKVVKYAIDITDAKNQEFAIAEQKQLAEAEERARQEHERAVAAEQQRKVETVLQVVNSLADGDFSVDIEDLGNDAIGQVAHALNAAIASVRDTMSRVREVVGTVDTASSELNEASNEISRGAQHQASSLEETASSLEEITSTVKQNSDNAQQARQVANGSRDVAERGGTVVRDAVQAMSEINQASTRISDIITTIDEIAFQTNLLALNAAVEAARAGEQGRGFAVVAAEVRNLAQRSASAAKEIKTLIQDSVRKVENGTTLVNRSGETLDEIVVSVKRVTDIVSEIASASKEQLTGIEQVNKAVSQMDRVTQNNASQTEEMAGTAESLQLHSEKLQDLISNFRLGENDHGDEDAARGDSRKRNRPRSNSRQQQRTERRIENDLDRVQKELGGLVPAAEEYIEF